MAKGAKVFGEAIYGSTGENPTTGIGFPPELAMYFAGLMDDYGTVYTDGNAASLGIGAFTEEHEYAASIFEDDNSSPSDTLSRVDDTAIYMPTAGGAVNASRASMDIDGWTLDWVSTSPGKMVAIALARPGIPLLDEGMLTGGLQPLGGGLG